MSNPNSSSFHETQKGESDAPTPLVKIGDFFVKREDESVTGSHKFRSLAYQLRALEKKKIPAAVLSSSGNAAISATHFAARMGIRLFVFLSEKTAPEKLAALTPSPHTTIILSRTPLRLAKYAAAHFHLPDLRPSVDENAARGFETLGEEIYKQVGSDVTNIFTFITSGASLIGIASAYQELKRVRKIQRLPRLFGVYSTGTLAGTLAGSGKNKLALAEKICRESGPARRSLGESGGALVEITDREIETTRKILAKQKIQTSNEGLASYAAAKKLRLVGKTVVVFTGKIWPRARVNRAKFQHAETFVEVDKIIQGTRDDLAYRQAGGRGTRGNKELRIKNKASEELTNSRLARTSARIPKGSLRDSEIPNTKYQILNTKYSKIQNPKSKIYLVSPDPKKIHGFEHAWSNLKIITNQKTPYLESGKKRGVDITFLNLPKVKGTADLLREPKVQRLIPRGSNLLVFKNLPRLEKIAAQNGWRVLMPDAKFGRVLEDKINFVAFCRRHRLPILPTRIGILNEFKFQKPSVVQLRHGHAGETTFFVRSSVEFAQLQKRIGEYVVKITPLVKLPTFSINLCVTRKQIFLTQPFYQITGDKSLNPNEGGTGGIDLALAQEMLGKKTREKILTLAERVGKCLRELGYRGIAGLDLLVDDVNGKIFLIECNPRLLANLGFLTRLQKEAGETSLLTLHLFEHLDEHEKKKNPQISAVKVGRQEVKH